MANTKTELLAINAEQMKYIEELKALSPAEMFFDQQYQYGELMPQEIPLKNTLET